MARGDQLARLLRIVTYFSVNRSATPGQLAERTGTSSRTAYRDLKVLREAGFQLHQENEEGESGPWRLMDSAGKGFQVPLSWSEVLGLLLVKGSVPQASLSGVVGAAFEKIEDCIPRAFATKWAGLSARITPEGSRRAKTVPTEILETVGDAMEAMTAVRFTYQKPSSPDTEVRAVDPWFLRAHKGTLYMVGRCHDRDAERMFMLERVSDLETIGETFSNVPQIDVEALFHGGLGPWGGEAEHIELVFAPESAGWAAERRFHPSQSSEQLDDGSLRVTFETAVTPPLVAEVMTWGPRVKVIEPETLALLVVSEARGVVDNYGDHTAQEQREKRAKK